MKLVFAIGLALLVAGGAVLTFSPRVRFEAQALFAGAPQRENFEVSQAHIIHVPATLRDKRVDPNSVEAVGVGDVGAVLLVNKNGGVDAVYFDAPVRRPRGLTSAIEDRFRDFRFRPFQDREGRTRMARVVAHVRVLPLERQPSRSIPFPSLDQAPVEVTLESTTCFGSCTPYVAIVHADGLIEVCLRWIARDKAWRRSRIAPDRVQRLLDQFRAADFFSLEDRYSAHVTDGPLTTLRLKVGANTKTIVDYFGEEVGMPSSVTRLEEAVDQIANTREILNTLPPSNDDAWAQTDACPKSIRYEAPSAPAS